MSLTVGSLFSGIGGIDLGLERAGFRIAWQCEIDEYCQKVLAKHWPDVARYGDIRTVGKHNLQAVDLLAGGFPCQDISNAGKRAGITGERSGLWSEFYRLICELRPSFVLVENVAALLTRGIDTVLGDLAASGYDAEWQLLSAEAVGAPHLRERVFIVAYTRSTGRRGRQVSCQSWQETSHRSLEMAYTSSTRTRVETHRSDRQERQSTNTSQPAILRQEYGEISTEGLNTSCEDVSDPTEQRLPIRRYPGLTKSDTQARTRLVSQSERCSQDVSDALGVGWFTWRPEPKGQQRQTVFGEYRPSRSDQWAVEPDVGRTLDGFSSWLDRHRELTDETHECIMANGIIFKSALGDIHNATSKSLRARKVLRLLRIDLEEEKVQRAARGHGSISTEEVLLSYVRQLEKRWADETRVQLESEKTSQNDVRSVRGRNELDSASHRSEQREQQQREYTDALQALSRLLARHSEKAWSRYSRENAQALLSSWSPGWEDGIARVAHGIPARVDRLKGLGNAVVPQIAEYIGRCILASIEEREQAS